MNNKVNNFSLKFAKLAILLLVAGFLYIAPSFALAESSISVPIATNGLMEATDISAQIGNTVARYCGYYSSDGGATFNTRFNCDSNYATNPTPSFNFNDAFNQGDGIYVTIWHNQSNSDILTDCAANDAGYQACLVNADFLGTTEYVRTSGVWTQNYSGPDLSTHFISVTPTNGTTTATSTSFTLGASGYVASSSLQASDYMNIYLEVRLRNNGASSQNVVGPMFAFLSLPRVDKTFTWPLYADGDFDLSTTTSILQIGDYSMTSRVYVTHSSWFGLIQSQDDLISTSTVFTIATSTPYDLIKKSVASTTANLADLDWQQCNVLLGFDPAGCLGTLFMPTPDQFESLLKTFKANVLSKFPVGYVTSIVDAIASSSTSTLPVIDATVPNGIPGAGANISLSLNSFSWILNSTSTFTTGALATSTLYEIVSPYWNTFVYMCLVIYILSRILGSHVIGHFGTPLSNKSK